MKTTKAIINPIIVPMSSSMETSIPDPEQNDTHYEEFQENYPCQQKPSK